MTKDKYVLWSDIDLDFDDWKDDLQAEYPEMSENELLAVMYKINADHLGDERMNLDKSFLSPLSLLVILAGGTGVCRVTNDRFRQFKGLSVYGLRYGGVVCGQAWRPAVYRRTPRRNKLLFVSCV